MIAGNSLYWGLADSIIDQKVRKKVWIADEKAWNAGELIKEG
jgi:hypothetical protein